MTIVAQGSLWASPLVACMMIIIVLAGCGSFEFHHAQSMDEERFRFEVERPAASALVLLHQGDDAVSRALGPIVERIAEMSLEGLKVYHWDRARSACPRTVLGSTQPVAAVLFEKGKAVDFIRSYANDDAVNRGLFCRLLIRRLIPGGIEWKAGALTELYSPDFDEKVLRAKKPVVLVFKNESG